MYIYIHTWVPVLTNRYSSVSVFKAVDVFGEIYSLMLPGTGCTSFAWGEIWEGKNSMAHVMSVYIYIHIHIHTYIYYGYGYVYE